MKKIALLFLIIVSLCACESQSQDSGVVARVNGKPIYLDDLQFKHDITCLADPGSIGAGVGKLREDYGNILVEMIVLELVDQELDEKGLSVTEFEVKNAEKEVRDDYPEGAFEQILVEECVDINDWRKLVRKKLALDKFRTMVLRPKIKITPQEAEEYYKEHITDFYYPSKLELVQVWGPNLEVVEKALSMYKSKKVPLDELQNKFENMTIRQISIRKERLPDRWSRGLFNLKPGHASQVITADTGYEFLVYKRDLPPSMLEPSRAYPLVERVLLETKLTQAFNNWVERALGEAKLEVSEDLISSSPRKDDENQKPE